MLRYLLSAILLCVTGMLTAQTDTLYTLDEHENYLTGTELSERLDEMRERARATGSDWTFVTEAEQRRNDTLIFVGHLDMYENVVFNKRGENMLIGKPLYPFRLRDMRGRMVNNKKLMDRVVVMNFWFNACRPCIAEMPALNDLQQQFAHRKDVVFLSLTFDAPVLVREFLERHEFNWRHVPEADEFVHRFGASYPKTLVIDRTGVLRYFLGGRNGQPEVEEDDAFPTRRVAEWIEGLLAE